MGPLYTDQNLSFRLLNRLETVCYITSVDKIQLWTGCNNAKLNEEKCKELRIDFTRKTPVVNSFTPNSINNRNIDIVD